MTHVAPRRLLIALLAASLLAASASYGIGTAGGSAAFVYVALAALSAAVVLQTLAPGVGLSIGSSRLAPRSVRPDGRHADIDPATGRPAERFTPRAFSEVQSLAEAYKAGLPVVLDVRSIDVDLAKRLIDFASGLAYSRDGGMRRIGDMVFLLSLQVEASPEAPGPAAATTEPADCASRGA